MKITEIYPKGGNNKMREPLNIQVEGLNLPGITILGRTWTRDGAETEIYYNGESMSKNEFDYHRNGISYQNKMARCAAEDINNIYEILEMPNCIDSDQLLEIMNMVRNKCESRYGNRLPDSEYEVMVIFN